MAKEARKPEEGEVKDFVKVELANRSFLLTIELNMRAMARMIKREFAVSLTEEEIEHALLDILWDVRRVNPNIIDIKIQKKSLGKTTFELNFCPVPIQTLSGTNFHRLLHTARVNKPIGT